MAGLFQSLGGLFAQRGVQAIAAGLLSGVVGGSALVISGIVPVGGRLAADTVALTTCPGFGPVLATVPAGQTLLVTGRSADGTWLQIYVGQPGIDRAWAPADDLRLQSAADGLPIEDCTPALTTEPPTAAPSAAPSPTVLATVAPTPSPTAGPTTAPTPTPTATPRVTPKPTPKVTPKPTPTPAPTPVPDTTPPSLSNLVITSPNPSGDGTYNILGQSCPFGPYSATIRVKVTDASNITDVTLSYWPGNVANPLNTNMSFVGNNNWQATITAQDSWGAGHDQQQGLISYWVQAEDEHGNVSQVLNGSNQYELYKEICLI